MEPNELKEAVKELEDYEFLELIKQEISRRFEEQQYEIGFDASRQTEAFTVSLKLLLDHLY